jgi:hypothetical protein
MQGSFSLLPDRADRQLFPRTLRDAVAVLYRQLGLIVLCTLAGAMAAVVIPTLKADEAARKRASVVATDSRTQANSSMSMDARLAKARQDLRQSEDRIAALFSGHADRRALKIDRGSQPAAPAGAAERPGLSASAGDAASPTGVPLRLDGASRTTGPDAGNSPDPTSRTAAAPPSPSQVVPERTPLEAELNRLERARHNAQQRFAALAHWLDEGDLSQELEPTAAGLAGGIGIADPMIAAEQTRRVDAAWLGTLVGLLAGILVAGWIELAGDRMRSRREVERALGVPVLGSMPTLSAKARQATLTPQGARPSFLAAQRA